MLTEGVYMTDSVTLDDVKSRCLALCQGEDDHVALMATLAGELFHGVDGFDWVGFYRVTAPGILKIGPYQGGHGCLQIAFDQGVCGAAARQEKTQLVDDVDAFPGHIACASSTRSELVVPCFDQDGQLFAVLDIDSDQPAFFTEKHQVFCEDLVQAIFS